MSGAATHVDFTVDLQEALRAAANNSAYSASRALSKWLNRGVSLQTDGFERIPITEAAHYTGEPDAAVAAVHMVLEGDIQGNVLLVMPEAVGRRLVEILMQTPPGSTCSFGEMEQSALQETGNIVGTSFANALAQWLNLRVVPASPAFAYDLACAVVEPVLLADAAERDYAWLTKTAFEIDGERLDWCMLLLLTGESLERIRGGPADDYAKESDLHTVAVNAAFNASRSMHRWLGKRVRISSAGLRRTQLHELHQLWTDDDGPAVILHMVLEGQLTGSLLLVMKRTSAMQLIGCLAPDLPMEERLGEMGQSCLQETANIVSTAFANSVAKWLDLDTRPSPPVYHEDMPDAAFESLLASQAQRSDEVLVSKTSFHVENCEIECALFVLPSQSAFRLIDACLPARRGN